MSAIRHDLILLKGAPGVGKSSAAKSLAGHCPSGVRIEVDALREMVIGVKWTDQSEHRLVLTLAANLAAGFLRGGFAPVILIDTFSGDKIDGFLDALRFEQPQARVCVYVLFASEDVLRDRVFYRAANGFRNLAVSMQINGEAVRDARSFETLIDTSVLSSEEVASEILCRLVDDP